MKRTVGITLAAILAFAAILIARMPASWLMPQGPKAAFSCTADRGFPVERIVRRTHFPAHCPLGDVSWELAPLKLLLARLAAHVTLTREAAHASADVEVGLSGRLTARNLIADLPLDPKLMPGLPPKMSGDAHAAAGLPSRWCS